MKIQKTQIVGSLGNYKWQITEDGTQTLFSSFFGEACHSLAGAREETIYNYIMGCDLVNRSKLVDQITIFETGFGTALGWECSTDFLSTPLLFISCELDEKLAIKMVEKLGVNFKVIIDNGIKYIEMIKASHRLIVLLGDIREVLPLAIKFDLIPPVDAIYQDAFSPKRNPRLWTTQWFELLAQISNDQTIMSTYSSTKSVWKSMIEAGWKVNDVKGYRTKKISTRAKRTGKTSSSVLDLIRRSPIPAMTDENINDQV